MRIVVTISSKIQAYRRLYTTAHMSIVLPSAGGRSLEALKEYVERMVQELTMETTA